MNASKTFLIVAAAFGAAAVAGCRTLCGCGSAPSPKHVVFIGFDGWGATYMDDSVKMPNLRRLMAEGSWTMEKKSILPSSSAANWASIYMAAGPEQHGYTAWDSKKSVFPPLYTLPNGRFPDVYALCRMAEPKAKMGYVYEWSGMAFVIDTNACDFVRQSAQCAEAGVEYLKTQKPRMMSFVYDSPDHQGHGQGYGSETYKKMLGTLDGKIGMILKAIDEAGMTDDTVVIVSSDHGGVKKGHGGATVAEMTSPFVIWGKGIRRGHQIKSTVNAYDLGATMAALLGLDLPQICTGRAVTEAFD